MLARRPDRLPSRKTVVFFAAVAAVSVTALVWMGVRLLAQDRVLEAQRLKERQEVAADRVVAALEQQLLAAERRLADPRTADHAEADDQVLLAAGPAGIRVIPERVVLFLPEPPVARDAPAALYMPAERFEFVDRNYDGAIAVLRLLTASRDPSVRAGAELRLARNLRKAGRPDQALEIYGELARGTGTVSGLPAGLVGRSGRGLLLEELGRRDQLRKEAVELQEGLATGRWTLDRDAYLHYAGQAVAWRGADSRGRQPGAFGRGLVVVAHAARRATGPAAINGAPLAQVPRRSGHGPLAHVGG
jgi:hypothetical protein